VAAISQMKLCQIKVLNHSNILSFVVAFLLGKFRAANARIKKLAIPRLEF
jgi:hypothetical protein